MRNSNHTLEIKEIESRHDNNENTKGRIVQILSASGSFLSTISSGMTSGFSAVLLPQLKTSESIIEITENQASWIASIAVLPMALGCLLSGFMMEKFGRCTTQRIGNILFVIGWVVIGFSNSYESICVGRMLTGLCTGIFCPLCLVYIAEICDPVIRGVMLGSIPLAISTGIFISHMFGTLFYWKIAALLCAAFPAIGFIIMLFAVESPSWLIFKGYKIEGETVFRKLRGFSTESSNELKSMLGRKYFESDDRNSKKITVENILSLTFIKPLLIVVCFFFIQQFSGVNAIIFYSISILSSMNSDVNEYLSTILLDILRVIMSIVACVLLKKYKRRTLAIVSTLMTGFSLLGISISRKYISEEYSWLSLPFITSYICFISIGTVPIPWILTGEIFPTHVRNIGSGCCTCFAFIMFFVVVKTSPHLFITLGTGNIFLIFAVITLVGSCILYFLLPETKDMTLQNIENKLVKRNTSSTTK